MDDVLCVMMRPETSLVMMHDKVWRALQRLMVIMRNMVMALVTVMDHYQTGKGWRAPCCKHIEMAANYDA